MFILFMKKRQVVVSVFVLLFIISLCSFVIAQSDEVDVTITNDIEDDSSDEDSDDTDSEDISDVDDSSDADFDYIDMDDTDGEDMDDGGIDLEELEEEYSDEDLGDVSSSVPVFEFIFKNFRDELENKERRIGDIRKHIRNGDYEKARMALREYHMYADSLEEEIDPDKREDARKSAVRIRKALREIESELSEGQKEEFYEDILDAEEGIVTAVEIADKIKTLCVQLAELDPKQYVKICKTEDDAPAWQKKLNKKLTSEQEKEAKEFGKIMGECFKTSGRNCNCEDISFEDFSIACNKIAPLAEACDEGDEEACKEMDEIEMPELPEHLEDVLMEIEMKYGEAKYDMHMPPECKDAGVEDPQECMLIMVKIHSPPECREAIEAGVEDGSIKGERDAKNICSRLMMPSECQGLDDPEECAKKMMPPECREKGLDPEECGRYMDSMNYGDFGPRDFRAPGKDCMGIEDSSERLKCFEEGVDNVGEHYGIGDKYNDNQGEITWQCKEHRIHWPPDCERFMRDELPRIEKMEMEERDRKRDERDYYDQMPEECRRVGAFSKDACDRHMRESGEFRDNRYSNEHYTDPMERAGCDDCSSKCPGASRTGCIDNRCECFYEDKEPPRNDDRNDGDLGQTKPSGDQTDDTPPSDTSSDGDNTSPPPSDTSSDGDQTDDTPPSDTSSDGDNTSPAPITGNVVGERFFKYWIK